MLVINYLTLLMCSVEAVQIHHTPKTSHIFLHFSPDLVPTSEKKMFSGCLPLFTSCLFTLALFVLGRWNQPVWAHAVAVHRYILKVSERQSNANILTSKTNPWAGKPNTAADWGKLPSFGGNIKNGIDEPLYFQWFLFNKEPNKSASLTLNFSLT